MKKTVVAILLFVAGGVVAAGFEHTGDPP